MPRWFKSISFWPKISRNIKFLQEFAPKGNLVANFLFLFFLLFSTNEFFTFRKFVNYRNVHRLFVFNFRFKNFVFELLRIFGALIKKSFQIFDLDYLFRLFANAILSIEQCLSRAFEYRLYNPNSQLKRWRESRSQISLENFLLFTSTPSLKSRCRGYGFGRYQRASK